jgi:hypothetical protein
MKVSYHVLPLSVVVNFDGKTFTLNKSDVRYEAIIQAIRDNKLEDIPKLVDIQTAYANSGLKLKDNLLWLDGESLPESLSDRVLAFQEQKLPFEHLIKFARKLRLNPSYNSRMQLFKFLEHNGHPITTEGNFIAYRGVTEDFKDKYTRTFDNSIGSVCEVPRSQVDDNPNNTCSHGLHVACHEYAKGWASKLVEVEVDPRDVVAVPTDYNGTKMRVCKFKVVALCQSIRTEQLVDTSYNGETDIDESEFKAQDFESEETDDNCDNCGDSNPYGGDCTNCDGYSEPEIEDQWEEVQLKRSSLIREATWNRTNNELEVEFQDGTTYTYDNVPESEIATWEDATSPGSYFMSNIAYQYTYYKN